MAKLRLNIQLEEGMKQYCQEKSEEFGISMSGFISVVLAQYRQQQDGIKAMSDIQKLVEIVGNVDKLKEIEK